MVDVLQTQYGLAGPIVTDCGAIPGFICEHNYSLSNEQAVSAALASGQSHILTSLLFFFQNTL